MSSNYFFTTLMHKNRSASSEFHHISYNQIVSILQPGFKNITSQNPNNDGYLLWLLKLSFWQQTKPTLARSVTHFLESSCKNRPFDCKIWKNGAWNFFHPPSFSGRPWRCFFEMNCTLNKPSQWIGYHGKDTWLNIVAYFN